MIYKVKFINLLRFQYQNNKILLAVNKMLYKISATSYNASNVLRSNNEN